MGELIDYNVWRRQSAIEELDEMEVDGDAQKASLKNLLTHSVKRQLLLNSIGEYIDDYGLKDFVELMKEVEELAKQM